jgi:hypothetical protein
MGLKRIGYLIFVVAVGFLLTNCAASKEVKTPPKDRVYPLAEINLEKVFVENRGLRVVEENASTVDDYYRGGVQEKEEGEKRMKEGGWEDARLQLEKSNRYFRVVLKYFRED